MKGKSMFLYRYFYISLKRGFLCLSSMLAGLFVLLIVIVLFLFGAGHWMADYTQKQKITLAVSLPSDGAAERWMFSILKDMESIKESCNIIETSEEEAITMLSDGNVYGAVLIPEGFVSGIMTGKNLPAEIYLPQSMLQKEYIELLADAGASSLACAQAGIYAISDFAYSHGMKKQLPEILEELNRKYIRFTLKRPNYFNHLLIDNTNRLPLEKQYVVTGGALFLLLCMVSMSKLIVKNPRALLSKLSIYGISPAKDSLIQTAVVFVLLSVIEMGLFIPLALWGYGNSPWDIALLPGCVGILAAVFTVAPFGVFVYTFARSRVSGMLFLFLISLGMLFISGGFLPSYLLPAVVVNIGKYLPVAAVMESISNVFAGGYSSVGICFIWGALFIIFTMIASAHHYEKAGKAVRS